MLLEVFNVEHGGCALVTTSNGRRIMIDCGHNATTGWRPGTALSRSGIQSLDRLFITNYDEDHVSGFENLTSSVNVKVLVRNPSVSASQLRLLKSEDGMGRGINALANSIDYMFTGGPPPIFDEVDFGDATVSYYWNAYGPPPFGFDDENNLSLVVFIACGHHKIIFPGDLEKAGWKALLANRQFKQELHGVTLFVASHHGRENGYCDEVMQLCPNIRAIIISDMSKGFQSQETVDRYRSHASGFMHDGQLRRVLTTRRDASMTFNFDPNGLGQVYLNQAA